MDISRTLLQPATHRPNYEEAQAAEMSVLGAMFLDQRCTPKVTALISASDFYQEHNRLIFVALLTLYEENIPVDPVTLCHRLKNEGELERVGGAAYIAELVDFTPTSANVTHYARIMNRKTRERKVGRLARELALDPGNLQNLFLRLSILHEEEQYQDARKRLNVLNLGQLLQTSFPEREHLLSPLILTQSLSMVHAWRGLGKTHFALDRKSVV